MKAFFTYIFKGFRCVKYYVLGKIYAFCRYDKKFLQGRWFEGRFHGVQACGWRWVYIDAKNCYRLDVNQHVPWPVSAQVKVVGPENISFHPDDLNNFQGFGKYFQAIGKITIGKGCYIANNVGLITANHNISNLDAHLEPKSIVLGDQCWIGMNSVVLPGVTLGVKTIVGAGSVVTKSFPEGHCIIAGNPARKLRDFGENETEMKQQNL